MQQSHIAASQFGTAAADYLTSTVHATGADLAELAARFKLLPDARILDVGCGAGHATYAIAPYVREVCAYDVSPQMLEVVARTARERGLSNVRTGEGRAENLPYEAESFDAVVTRLSAHHWSDVRAAIREMHRVLKSGGIAIVIDAAGAPDPLCDSHLQAIELLRDRSHVRDYTPHEWQAFFAEAGFTATLRGTWRLDIDYAGWIARMRTPPERAAAILDVWRCAPEEVRQYFHAQNDGSFQLDVLQIDALKTSA